MAKTKRKSTTTKRRGVTSKAKVASKAASCRKSASTKKKASAKKKAPAAKKKAPAAKKKAPATKKKAPAAEAKAEKVVTISRRSSSERRQSGDNRVESQPVATDYRKLERRAKVSRRRQIDPTTCEREYTADEIEFMNALEIYKRRSGRMFPTCSEVLEVIQSLGYAKVASGSTQVASAEQGPVDLTVQAPAAAQPIAMLS